MSCKRLTVSGCSFIITNNTIADVLRRKRLSRRLQAGYFSAKDREEASGFFIAVAGLSVGSSEQG